MLVNNKLQWNCIYDAPELLFNRVVCYAFRMAPLPCAIVTHVGTANTGRERKREKAAAASRSLIAVPYNLCVRIEIEIYAWQIFNLILSGSTDKYHLVLFTIPYTFIGPTQWEAQCVDRVYIHVKYAL